MAQVKQDFSNLPSSLTQTVDPCVCNQLVTSASHCQVNVVCTLMSEGIRIRFCQELTLLLEPISADWVKLQPKRMWKSIHVNTSSKNYTENSGDFFMLFLSTGKGNN